jgi:hypothetical protein
MQMRIRLGHVVQSFFDSVPPVVGIVRMMAASRW